MLRMGLINKVREHLAGLGLDWEDFAVDRTELSFKLSFLPLPGSYAHVFRNSITGHVMATTSPHRSGLMSGSSMLKMDDLSVLQMFVGWGQLLGPEIEAHRVLDNIREHQNNVDALLARWEDEKGRIPDTPLTEVEIPEVMTSVEVLRTALEEQIRRREESEAEAQQMVNQLNARVSKLEQVAGVYPRRQFFRSVLSVILWFGKNIDTLAKIVAAVRGLLS